MWLEPWNRSIRAKERSGRGMHPYVMEVPMGARRMTKIDAREALSEPWNSCSDHCNCHNLNGMCPYACLRIYMKVSRHGLKNVMDIV